MTKQDFIIKWRHNWVKPDTKTHSDEQFEAELDLLLDAAYDKGWSDATKQATDEIHKNYHPND